MIRRHEIRAALNMCMLRNRRYQIEEIYTFVERKCYPDGEDYDSSAPGNNEPKWKRNVRNCLQTQRKKRNIVLHDNGIYVRVRELNWPNLLKAAFRYSS